MSTFDKWDSEFRHRHLAAFNHNPSALFKGDSYEAMADIIFVIKHPIF